MIRPYHPDDLPVIMDIGNRAWRPIHESFRNIYGPELFDILVPDPPHRKGKQVEKHCREHPEATFICQEDGRIVGFVTFHLDHERKIGEIGNNAVDPECGLKGIGQQMYRAVLAHFRQQGMRYAKVHTGLDIGHAPARRAYERIGFDIRQEDVNYYKKL